MRRTSDIENVIKSYPVSIEEKLSDLRHLVLSVAEETEGVGEIEECLKWGQPSFVTKKPKSGSTIRIDAVKDEPDRVAMYFICTTNLVESFRELYPETFNFEGNRALIFKIDEVVPEEELKHCIAMALTYHLN
ncbi:MAG: DUF1801 domain-containing protein [Pseudomonadota bacterium]